MMQTVVVSCWLITDRPNHGEELRACQRQYLAGGYNKTLSLTGPVNAPSMRQFEVGAGEVKQIDAGQLCEITTPPYDTPKTAAGTTPPGERAPAERLTPGLAWARKTSASTVL